MRRIFLVIISVLIWQLAYTQPSPEAPTSSSATSAPRIGTIKGKIIEEGSNIPLEYANVAVYSQTDSSLVSGGIADSNGNFSIASLPPGRYYVEAKFMGYNHTKKGNIAINRNISSVDLGVLTLVPASENISEVTVSGQSRAIAYEIDKKVIDPSQFPTAADGTAVDILAQTPSVSVDIEGNVALRGSSSFTVLIDGRPTPFSSADALQQIPASSIRNIEIITNPSAKFDPDGNAGIININTRRSRLQGVSGIVNAMGDTNGSLSGDLLLNYRTEKFNFFLSANSSNRRGGGSTESSTTTIDTITSNTQSFGEGTRSGKSTSIKTGFDYFMNDKNTLTFNFNYNQRNRVHASTLNFEEWNSLGYRLESLTENSSISGRDNYSLSLDYKRTFDRAGQELTGFLYYQSGQSDEISYYNQFDNNNLLIAGIDNWEVGNGQEVRAKLDYIHPFTGKKKMELGFQSRMDRDLEWNDVHWYTAPSAYDPSPSSPYYTDTEFSRDIHSLYGMFSNSNTIWGYQLGLRSEYTDRSIDYSGSPQPYTINRLDWFPTAHVSINLSDDQQLTTSYARRISRPGGFALEPFITYVDAYNVRQGNPDILPEYIDSYELGYQKQLKGGFISAEVYMRQTNNKSERVQSVYQQNVMMSTVANVGTDYSLGTELMLNYKPLKWWTVNLMGNIYNYRLEGEYNGRIIETKSNNWNSRFSNTFMLGKSTRLQVDAMYNSPTVTAQGRREGFLFTNMAIRQDFLKNKLTATLAIRDVLQTAKFEFESEGPNFSTYRSFKMNSPVVSMTLSYRINNFRPQRQNNNGGENGQGTMEMDGMEM